MHVKIISRIYSPEVSAASGLLQSWATEFRARGWEVTVVTALPPKQMAIEDPPGIRVRRAPVIRDRQQYVRGYLSYLSFDLPLFFRLLFGRKADLYIVEPPPTTVAVTRVVAALRRTPYLVDAADIWSDAAVMATRSRLVLKVLRRIERFALSGSKRALVVAEVYAMRMREIGVTAPTTVIGFGADTGTFSYRGDPISSTPDFVYAGTYSEWHGASVFLDAFAEILDQHPTARLRFIGNGQERELLRQRAAELSIAHAVEVLPPVAPAELVPILARATASLSSLKPGQGYDYAFTTKVFSSLAVGCPVVFAGVGPTLPFFQDAEEHNVGLAVDYEPSAVARAMAQMISEPLTPEQRRELSVWTAENHSLAAVATKVVDTSLAALDG